MNPFDMVLVLVAFAVYQLGPIPKLAPLWLLLAVLSLVTGLWGQP